MRPSVRCLQAVAHNARRANTTGFIGLGRMGYEMATNLFSKKYAASKDAQFVVCDAVPATAYAFRDAFTQKHPGSSVTVIEDLDQAAKAAGTIVTMLPSSPQVQEVYGKLLGSLSALPKEDANVSLFIDSTTLDVDVARQVALEAVSRGASMVDAPVSGGVPGAAAGTLSFMVGGPEESFKLAHPNLTLMGQRIVHCGQSGAGLGAKICNNLVLGVEQIVVAEAMLLGKKLGLNPAILASVINSSTGGCWSSSVNNPVPSALPEKSPPCERDYEGGFATVLMLKDMGLATDTASRHQSALPLGIAARDLYQKVVTEDPELARKDFSSIYRFLQERS